MTDWGETFDWINERMSIFPGWHEFNLAFELDDLQIEDLHREGYAVRKTGPRIYEIKRVRGRSA